MRFRWWVNVLFVAAALALPGSALGAEPVALASFAQAPVFKSATDQVRLEVLVSKDGLPVPGLTARDFEIRDNGVHQEPTLVTRAEATSILFVFDTSDSLTASRFRDLVAAGHALTEQLLPTDRVGLLTFGARPQLRVPLQEGAAGALKVNEALDALKTGGTTAMRDGIVAGLEALSGQPGSSLLVLFTDGEDNASTSSLADVLEAVGRTQAIIGVVAVGLNDDPSRPSAALDERERMLRLIAEANGGPLLRTESGPKRLDDSFSRVIEEFRGRYVLSYTPRQVARDDGWHTLVVSVRQCRARTRAGYYAGAAPTFATRLRGAAAIPPTSLGPPAAAGPLPSASAPAVLPPTPGPPPASDRPGTVAPLAYPEVVARYRSGEYAEAFEQLSRFWPLERLKREGGVRGVPPDPQAIAAATLLHTEMAMREVEAFQAGHLGLALELMDALKKHRFDPDFRRTWLLLAETLLRTMNDPRRGRVLERLNLEYENDPEVLLALGSASERAGWFQMKRVEAVWGPNLDAADQRYRKALAADPSCVEARLRLGRVLFLRGRRDEALVELQRALSEAQEPHIAYLAALFAGRLHERRAEARARVGRGPDHGAPAARHQRERAGRPAPPPAARHARAPQGLETRRHRGPAHVPRDALDGGAARPGDAAGRRHHRGAGRRARDGVHRVVRRALRGDVARRERLGTIAAPAVQRRRRHLELAEPEGRGGLRAAAQRRRVRRGGRRGGGVRIGSSCGGLPTRRAGSCSPRSPPSSRRDSPGSCRSSVSAWCWRTNRRA